MPCPYCDGKAEFDYDDDNLNWISCNACGIAALYDHEKPVLTGTENSTGAINQYETIISSFSPMIFKEEQMDWPEGDGLLEYELLPPSKMEAIKFSWCDASITSL